MITFGRCECGVAQNAAHLLECPKVGNGRGRVFEQIWRDPEWCRKVVRFLWKRWIVRMYIE